MKCISLKTSTRPIEDFYAQARPKSKGRSHTHLSSSTTQISWSASAYKGARAQPTCCMLQETECRCDEVVVLASLGVRSDEKNGTSDLMMQPARS